MKLTHAAGITALLLLSGVGNAHSTTTISEAIALSSMALAADSNPYFTHL